MRTRDGHGPVIRAEVDVLHDPTSEKMVPAETRTKVTLCFGANKNVQVLQTTRLQSWEILQRHKYAENHRSSPLFLTLASTTTKKLVWKHQKNDDELLAEWLKKRESECGTCNDTRILRIFPNNTATHPLSRTNKNTKSSRTCFSH